MERPAQKLLRNFLRSIKRLWKRDPEPPEDPYAYVGAPKKPRPPHLVASAAEKLD